MHPCLRLLEVLELICQNITRKRSLARLARVSRILKEPALDALYADIENLVDLVRSFPSGLWSLEYDCRSGGSYKLAVVDRQPSEAEWNNIRSYTSRVRTLKDGHFFFTDKIILPKGAFDAICKWQHPGDSLFPKLRHVCVHLGGDEWYRFVASFLIVPSLRRLELENCDQPVLYRNIPDIASRCPLLQTLDTMGSYYILLYNHHGYNPIASVSLNLRLWNNLQVLRCGYLDGDMLDHISGLVTLRSLTVPATEFSSWLYSRKSGYLGSLDHLTLTVDSFETGVRAIEKLFTQTDKRRSRLRSLDLDVETIQWDDEVPLHINSSLAAITSALSRTLCLSDFKEFSVEHLTRNEFTIDHAFINPFSDVLPLTAFTNLVHFEFSYEEHESFKGYHMNERELLDLLQHWPHLETIVCNDPIQEFSLSGLIAALRLCARLRTFMVLTTFSVGDIAELCAPNSAEVMRELCETQRSAEHLPCNHAISELGLSFYPVGAVSPDTAQTIATFLLRVVPNLAKVNSSLFDHNPKMFWDAVITMMARERRVRASIRL